MFCDGVQVFSCFHVWLAMYAATRHHVEGLPLPDPVEGKASYYPHYIFTTSKHAHKRMAQEAHYSALKRAMIAADMSLNGQVTHRARHETAVQLRTIHSAPAAEVCAHAGWNQSIWNQAYAQLPTGDLLAKVAGFGNRQHYFCAHALLDPSDYPQFQPMVEAFYPGISEKLKRLKKVMKSAW